MVLNYLENVLFRALQIRNDLDYVKSSYSMPPIHNHFYECDQPISRAVRGFVPSRVHRMISAGNLRGAIRYMGGGETDNIMQLVESRFKEELEEAKYKLQRYTNRNDQTRIEEWKTKVERIEGKLVELKNRFERAIHLGIIASFIALLDKMGIIIGQFFFISFLVYFLNSPV